jgi:hypothetical protein
MKLRLKKLLTTTLAFALTAGFVWVAIWSLRSFATYISAIPKELGAALVAGTAAVMVATVTVMIGRYFERKKELDALYRDKKMEIYDEFLKKFFDLFHSQSKDSPTTEPEDLVSFLREFMRKLILWSGPEPIAAFLAWKEHMSKGEPDAQTIFLTEKFLLTLRADLRHSNKGIPEGFFASIILKEAALFLSLAKKNPNVTLNEIIEAEKVLRGAVSDDTLKIPPNS